jgi:excisionase family DNA binding protein
MQDDIGKIGNHFQDNAALLGNNIGDGAARVVPLLHQRKYGVKQASELLGIGQTSLRRLICRGEINVLRIGGKVLVLEADIERLLKGCYGPMKEVPAAPKAKLSALPRHVRESGLFKKAG